MSNLLVEGIARPSEGVVRLRVQLPVPTDAAWSALTQPCELGEWLGRVEGKVAEGEHFVIWHDEETPSQHEVIGWDPGRHLELTWDFPGENVSRVLFGLVPDVGTTQLVLVHHVADPISYAAGWHRHLEYLAAHLAAESMDAKDFWTGHDDLVGRYTATAQ